MSSKKYGSKFLKGFRNYRAGPELEAQVIHNYLSSLNCPRALAVWLLYENNEHEQLANLSFEPLTYGNKFELRDAYAATKFLSKFKGLSLDYDLDEVALTKFKKFELRCKQTNERFRNLSIDPSFTGPIVWIHNVSIRKIEAILGLFEPEEFVMEPDWGPGASTTIRRRDASPSLKFQLETGITRDLYSLLPTDLLQIVYPLWTDHLKQEGFPSFQVGNKVVTVPKDASTNRVIAIEPGINLWFQKSIGNMIGRRLRRIGIDLTDQGRNQKLALSGSITGELATVDLSSASDSISVAVVRELLPEPWLSVLDSCRSHFGHVDGLWKKWEKFSSMGNGFTFQLESLIFYAVAFACTEYLKLDTKSVSVYGDDVILPTSAFNLFAEALAFYGFQVNEKKSHYNSTFRESCGAHYASGLDVKPIYLKDRVSSVLSIYRLANAIRRLASRRNILRSCDARLQTAFDLLVQKVPKAFRFKIPEGFGDGGFVTNFDEATPSRLKHGIEGYRVIQAVEGSTKAQEERLGYLLAELWRLSKRDIVKTDVTNRPTILKAIRDLTELDARILGRNSVPLHRTQLRISASMCRQWTDVGPWL